MVHRLLVRTAWVRRPAHFAGALAALALVFLSACSGQLPPVVPATPALPPSAATLAPTATAPDAALLDLPPAFRYEVTLRPVQAGADPTVISGQYRDGAWAQTARTGGEPGEELIVVRDAATGRLNSYTRAAGDSDWTRWPGVTFEAAYGLASPFTVLRLRPLATRSAAPAGTPVASGETQSQALFSTEVVQRLLTAGVDAAGPNDDARAALEQQIAPFFVPQTVTYALDPSGKVLRAAATLLSLGPDNQPAPWVELTAAYSAYDDPAIAVAAAHQRGGHRRRGGQGCHRRAGLGGAARRHAAGARLCLGRRPRHRLGRRRLSRRARRPRPASSPAPTPSSS